MVPFAQFPFRFNLGARQVALAESAPVATADTVWGDSESGDPKVNDSYFVSGKANGGSTVPVRCPTGKSRAYLELSDLAAEQGAFYGKRWVSGNSQQVEGGEGALKAINAGKEPTGRMVYGNLFKVVLTGTNESTGTADFGLYFRICNKNAFVDLGCSPYFLGPIPWIPVPEKQLVVVGAN